MPWPNLNIKDLLDATYGHCAYCGRLLDAKYGRRPRSDWILVASGQTPEMEHVTPLSRGGTNDPSNFLPSCERCNDLKGRLTIDEFRLLIGLCRGNPSFTFPLEKPDIQRDWICVHSDIFERRLLHRNFPKLAASYKPL